MTREIKRYTEELELAAVDDWSTVSQVKRRPSGFGNWVDGDAIFRDHKH